MSKVRCILDAKASVGESPVWSAEEQVLYWVDSLAPALYRLDPYSGERQSWLMPDLIGSLGLREGGGAVVALRNGMNLLDFETGALTLIAPNPEDGQFDTRLNDGKVAPDGRFWVGGMDQEHPREAISNLYRLDADHSLHQMLDGITVSNGLAWSPDGKTMYHADSPTFTIKRYDYDLATGTIANPRILVSGPETGGPDGGATDMEGYYWSAAAAAGVLNRWSPDGRLDRQIKLPVPRPSCPCFGGPDMKTLFITSLSTRLSAQQHKDYPLSGGVFAIDVDVPGVPVAKYRG